MFPKYLTFLHAQMKAHEFNQTVAPVILYKSTKELYISTFLWSDYANLRKYLIGQIPFKDVSFSLKFFNQSLLSNNLSVETLIVNVNKVKKCAIMLSQTVENKIYSMLQFRITTESRF